MEKERKNLKKENEELKLPLDLKFESGLTEEDYKNVQVPFEAFKYVKNFKPINLKNED